MHEASLHEANAFTTLTYSDKHLPTDYSVDKRTLQLFQKRLRKKLGTTRIRFFGCGEYGGQTLRPHYHLLIFGWFPPDAQLYKRSLKGNLFRSDLLDEVWGFGDTRTGSITYTSASYCSRYIVKKIGGDMAADHYLRIHPLTGAQVRVRPEFQLQSSNPGIGAGWFDKYKDEVFPSDFIILDGHKVPVPKFYLNKLHDEQLRKIQQQRREKARQHKPDQTRERLAVRETVLIAKLNSKSQGTL